MVIQSRPLLLAAIALLGLRVLLGIVFEYRFYFPPNFTDAAFLIGREETFTRLYAAAFYTHILSGPPAIVLATFLLATGGQARWRTWHRWGGRWLGALIFALLLPSGLIMARHAFAGPIAGVGFAALTLTTALCAGFAIACARQKRFVQHQRWATRCFLLLISPLILRVVSGVLIVTNSESETAYQLNAWLSWIVPLLVYEVGLWNAKPPIA
jgi:hypothetical protein